MRCGAVRSDSLFKEWTQVAALNPCQWRLLTFYIDPRPPPLPPPRRRTPAPLSLLFFCDVQVKHHHLPPAASSHTSYPCHPKPTYPSPMPEASVAVTYYGHVGSTQDALILIEACLRGHLNHTSRRPRSAELTPLGNSGNVFVYESRSSGITSWRDGLPWSQVEKVGNFELSKQLAGNCGRARTNGEQSLPPERIQSGDEERRS